MRCRHFDQEGDGILIATYDRRELYKFKQSDYLSIRYERSCCEIVDAVTYVFSIYEVQFLDWLRR